MDETTVEKSVYYQLGLRSIAHAEEVIDRDVVEEYGGFSEEVKSHISIVEFSTMTPSIRILVTNAILRDGTVPPYLVLALPGLLESSIGGIVEKARLLIRHWLCRTRQRPQPMS
jgi:hypothetical protein